MPTTQTKKKRMSGYRKLYSEMTTEQLLDKHKQLDKEVDQAIRNDSHWYKGVRNQLDIVQEILRERGVSEESFNPVEDDIAW